MLAALALLGSAVVAQTEGEIVSPADGAWVRGDEVAVIAKGALGQLTLDGEPVDADEPFPGVLRARVSLVAGPHTLRLESDAGVQEVRFRSGPEGPEGESASPFVEHPPVRTECAHCHSVSRRGRFRFSGGCESCHTQERFVRTHSHEPHELASCGQCHDAHGSSAAKLLSLPANQACKQCHN